MKRSTVCVNIDQSDVTKGGFTDAEKAQARRNIGVTNYNRITHNVTLAMSKNTSDNIYTIHLYDFKLYNGHEYHTFVTVPSGIQLANYSKDKVILTLWIGAANWTSAPFKMRLRCDVENGVVKNRSSIIPIDWLGENLTTDVLDYIHFSFFDNDNDSLVGLVGDQTLSFSFRGTESYVQ